MYLKNCNLCPLREQMHPIYSPCEPLQNQGADIMIVSYQPTEDEIELGIIAGTEYDLLSKVISDPFYFTHLVKCTGKVTSNIVNTCMVKWLEREIDSFQPKLVVTMGKDVSYYLIPDVKRKDSIREIAGKKYSVGGVPHTPSLSSASIINGGKSSLFSFQQIFN